MPTGSSPGALDRRLDVPGDQSIIEFDDSPAAPNSRPLTVVRSLRVNSSPKCCVSVQTAAGAAAPDGLMTRHHALITALRLRSQC